MPGWMILLLAMPAAGIIVYTLLDRWMGWLDTKEKVKTTVDKLNEVKACNYCGRFSRNYQRELAHYDRLLKGESMGAVTEVCPHCQQEATFYPISDIRSFHKYHIDCLPLEVIEYAEHQRHIEEYERLLYASKVNESFQRRLADE
ncbi:hypothetical protein [Bacillus sp. REN10]|uniref:hypothetical protein n=1 Tax=Bacillus sp. REN10 TaxID=2782541 RepID=UPI00193BCC24|nr:hypothetical protein [Bacillus sp. REN10]